MTAKREIDALARVQLTIYRGSHRRRVGGEYHDGSARILPLRALIAHCRQRCLRAARLLTAAVRGMKVG